MSIFRWHVLTASPHSCIRSQTKLQFAGQSMMQSYCWLCWQLRSSNVPSAFHDGLSPTIRKVFPGSKTASITIWLQQKPLVCSMHESKGQCIAKALSLHLFQTAVRQRAESAPIHAAVDEYIILSLHTDYCDQSAVHSSPCSGRSWMGHGGPLPVWASVNQGGLTCRTCIWFKLKEVITNWKRILQCRSQTLMWMYWHSICSSHCPPQFCHQMWLMLLSMAVISLQGNTIYLKRHQLNWGHLEVLTLRCKYFRSWSYITIHS